ncbi:ATP-binding cassette domain-containing protein [Herbiconiux sp.]|uniref:ABC transporter ATP-binding protein n=1 Tax=Herbiconiux sp. TaxID=1871186 RepID=UPI0025C3667B|nr:ATP-binding cassette domain-containing protein [Herbiconiux sp.]
MSDTDRAAARTVDVTVRAPGSPRPLLAGVSLELAPGERMLVLGPSGSGKSSLVNVLTGVIPFSQNLSVEGAVLLGGADVSELPVVERARRVGAVAQDPAAAVCLARVDDEMALPLENHGVDPSAISGRIDDALGLVGAGGLRERATSALSGGELQRVAMAAALAGLSEGGGIGLAGPTGSPADGGVAGARGTGALGGGGGGGGASAVLLLDEPTSMLDPAGVRAVRGAVARVAERGEVAVLLVEHRLDEFAGEAGARGLPEKALVLDGSGGVVACGPTVEVLAQNAQRLHDAGCWLPLETELLAITGRPGGLDSAEVGEWLRGWLRMRPVATAARSSPVDGPGEGDVEAPDVASVANHDDRDPLLSARSLVVGRPAPGARRSRGRRAPVDAVLAGVDLELPPGEVVALLGANGSGKTSLLLTLAGLLPAAGGAVAGARPSMVFQNPELQFLGHRVRDEIGIGVAGSRDEVAEIVDRQLAVHRLEHVADRDPYRLSGGEKRRLSLAAMLAHADRPVLLADEPAFGLDRRDTVATADVFRTEAARGRAVVFSSHDLRFVATVADRVIVLADGGIAADGPTVTVLRNADVLRRAGLELPPLVAWLLAETAPADPTTPARDVGDVDAVRVLRWLYATGAHPEATAPPLPTAAGTSLEEAAR